MKLYQAAWLFCLCLSCFLFEVQTQGTGRPIWRHDMAGYQLSEDKKVGQQIYDLNATIPGGGEVFYRILESPYFYVSDRLTGIVKLLKEIDYDTLKQPKQLNVRVQAINANYPDQFDERYPAVIIRDINDEIPKWDKETFTGKLSEDTPIGTTIIANITFRDVDTVNNGMTAYCDPAGATAENQNICQEFYLEKVKSYTKNWTGHLISNTTFDYEKRHTYQIPLMASDGIQKKLVSAELTILNVQDTPPIFIKFASIRRNEEVANFTDLNLYLAEDGDGDKTRQMRYRIIDDSPVSKLFYIDPVSGHLYNLIKLDREDFPFKGTGTGSIKLTIEAGEKDPNFDDIGTTLFFNATRIEISLQIDDINDNKPTFKETSYTVDVTEGEKDNTPVDGLVFNVEDLDVDEVNHKFDLLLSNYNDRFALTIDTADAEANVLLQIKNTSLLDYDKGVKTYKFQVIAREKLTQERYSSIAEVTVNLKDENDNSPVFNPPVFVTQVKETYQDPDPIIKIQATDIDDGLFGTTGIQYEMSASTLNLFRIDPKTGDVYVVKCATPGRGNCIDYEQQKSYSYTVTAADNNGKGRKSFTQLLINILDENDNAPVFTVEDYVADILQGQTVPRNGLTVQATDVDTVGGPLMYSMLDNPGGFWQVDAKSGEVTAVRGVQFDDAPNGVFALSVLVVDGNQLNDTSNILINVIDTNDFAPKFDGDYEISINETTPGGTSVITIRATDGDASTHNNGKIDYAILSGSDEKFTLNGQVVLTGKDATFDYKDKDKYIMTLQARDRGQPQKTGTATLTVNILDMNNKNPVVNPAYQRADVYENEIIDYKLHQIKATDADVNSKLQYFFIEPKKAQNAVTDNVDRNDYDFTNLFRVDVNTGDVFVNSKLDNDKASYVTYTIKVVDANAVGQTGIGTLLIQIKEVNVEGPTFVNLANVTIEEEKNRGSRVTIVQARDTDNAIDQYELIENPNDYFSINYRTGLVTINKILDFEEVESTYFRVRVYDDGIPRLQNETTIYVNILNINDNLPECDKSFYNVLLPEHSPAGTPVQVLSATDKDKGDFGVVRFSIDSDPRFTVDPIKGNVVVAANQSANLDRESEALLVVQVKATDSPLQPALSRFTYCSMYISLQDINDNAPKFDSLDYEYTILDTMPPGASILQIRAKDKDEGNNGLVAYKKVPNSGDPDNYFTLELRSGIVLVNRNKNLRGQAGTYTFAVEGRDEDGSGPFFDRANVKIIVIQASNSIPLWQIPPNNNMSIEVLEEQYLGMYITEVHAIDQDKGKNGKVDYHIFENGVHKPCTAEFCINTFTGVIIANIVFDRERVDQYTLLLTVRDHGNPRLENTRYLKVVIMDVNDNKPEFARAADGSVLPLNLQVQENTPVKTVIGRVEATDRDKDPKIYYYIINGNEKATFSINSTTGEIILEKKLDREDQSIIELSVQASNNIPDYTVIRNRRRRATDPSIISVKIIVGNTNDASPVFTKKQYHGCVSVSSPVGQSIIQVEAKDEDSSDVRYSIFSGNTRDAFNIGVSSGVISNRILMQDSKDAIYQLKIEANDRALNDTAEVVIFVTEEADSVTSILSQPASEVRKFIKEIQLALEKLTDRNGNPYFKFICYSTVTDHVLDNGETTSLWADVTLSAVCENCVAGSRYHVYTGEELLQQLKNLKEENPDGFDLLYIKDFKLTSETKALTDRTPVLVVMIIIILLFVIILIFLIIACYCIRRSHRNQREKALLESQRHEEPLEDPVIKNVNPMYDNFGYDPEPAELYAKVHKPSLTMDRPQDPEPVPPVLLPDPEPEEEEPVIIDTVETEYTPEFISDPSPPPSETQEMVIETELVNDNNDDRSLSSEDSEFRIETTVEEQN